MQELLINLLFYAFAGLAILSAFLVITQNNPVRCVLFLVLTFIASSVLWILVKAEFLALILVLVYVGAVMTLFLFVVMMLNIDTESTKTHLTRYLPFGLIIVALLTTLLLLSLPNRFTIETEPTAQAKNLVLESMVLDKIPLVKPMSNTEKLGMVLYTDYVYAFEMAAVILLVAIIAAITLVHRDPHHRRTQNIVRQIMTRKDERLKLVSMPAEKQ